MVKTKPDVFYTIMQRKIAVTAVGISAVRNQGKGVLKACQDYLAELDLDEIPKSNQTDFEDWLDKTTKGILDSLPIRNRPWGTARKALNLFLRDLFYNRYFNSLCDLDRLEKWFEIPMDSAVANGLIQKAGKTKLPSWPGLKHLKKTKHAAFQKEALDQAQKLRIERIHLDMYLWLENR